MCPSRRTLVSTLLAGCVGVAAATGYAQTLQAFPVKPIRLVVPFPVGSPSDALARTIGPRMSATEVTRILNLADVNQTLLTQGLVAVTTPQGDYNQTLRSQLTLRSSITTDLEAT